jgi:hypothetical protein
MLATAVAAIGARYRTRLPADPIVLRWLTALTAVGFAIVAFVALLGVFVNKVAPLE